MTRKQRPIVEVEWQDATHHDGWGVKLTGTGLNRCRTTGYLLKKDRVRVVVCQSEDEDGNQADLMVIPRSSVFRIRRKR